MGWQRFILSQYTYLGSVESNWGNWWFLIGAKHLDPKFVTGCVNLLPDASPLRLVSMGSEISYEPDISAFPQLQI
jgi:hypothetical protein